MSPLLAFLVFQTNPDIQVNYASGRGLVIKWRGITVIDGSGFQYYEPGWSKGYYSSHWSQQDVQKQADGGAIVKFRSDSGAAEGSVIVHPADAGVKVEYVFRWHGDHPIQIENGIGVVRKNAFSTGSADGGSPQKLAATGTDAGIWFGAHRLTLSGPLMGLTVQCPEELSALDGDKVSEDWNAHGDSIWVGSLALPIKPEQEVRVSSTWTFDSSGMSAPRDTELTPTWSSTTLPGVPTPELKIADQPKIAWRGIHLFVGPASYEFQKRLIERVLKPLKFNHVVLQCERTHWDAAPGIDSPLTMSQAELVRLFELYRKNGIEPIPLIQSFGHEEWLLGNSRYRNLAYNPDKPYALDPRKPAAQKLIADIWDEAIRLLHPKTIHFGMDEVDMIGFGEKDADEVTSLWRNQVSYLMELAQRHHVTPMMWGDKMLAPGEALDATNGDTPAHAKSRREALAPGTVIADWHYKSDSNSAAYGSLKLWRDAGMLPIASTWFQLPNIAGFTKAAEENGVGTLLTTWAGYESNEENMLNQPRQFSAIAFAGLANSDPDSALNLLRGEGAKTVGTRMTRVFQSLFYGAPTSGARAEIASGLPLPMQGVASPEAPASASFKLDPRAAEVFCKLQCERLALAGESIGQVILRFTDGSSETHDLVVGIDVAGPGEATFRAADGVLRLNLAKKAVTCITVRESGPFGLRVDSLSLVP